MTNLSEQNQHELDALQRRVETMDARVKLLAGSALVAVAVVALSWAGVAMSDPAAPDTTVYNDLYQFTAGEPAVALEVNSNFAALHGLINGNATAINGNAAAITGNQSSIASLQNGKLDKSGGTISGDLTVSGRLGVGFTYRTCPYQDLGHYGDCSCKSNEVVISGGSYGHFRNSNGFQQGRSLRESRPINVRTWRVACVDENGTAMGCQTISVLCARLE